MNDEIISTSIAVIYVRRNELHKTWFQTTLLEGTCGASAFLIEYIKLLTILCYGVLKT